MAISLGIYPIFRHTHLVVFVPVHADFLVNCVGLGNVYLQFDGGKVVCILLGPAKTCISG